MPVLAVALVVAALVAFWAWVVMVIWGALALTFGLQTIGYGTSFLVVAALSIIASFLNKD